MNLVLIGYRGTGKSTVARRVALALDWDWIDTDVELELRAGRTIAAIFADEGEPAFRDLESQVLADLAARDRTVIAAGGGVVLRPDNRAVLRTLGRVAWLRADADTIAQRLAADETTRDRRPNLTVAGGREEIEQLLAVREPLYAECADVTVETSGGTPDEIAAEVLARVRPMLSPESRP
ncbi:MAG: shikimate kinase [Pirellulales bacterium]|nr:shikimate kinase [Pirellulales bacterium]